MSFATKVSTTPEQASRVKDAYWLVAWSCFLSILSVLMATMLVIERI